MANNMRLLCAALAFLIVVVANAEWFPLTAFTDPTTDADTFSTLADPFMQAMSLSYTATSGGYYNPSTVNATIFGYAKSHLVSDPACGMRALVFVEDANENLGNNGNRMGGGGLRSEGKDEQQITPPNVLIVFRGTDLSGANPSSQCDMCADDLIFNNITAVAKLPTECQAYTWDQLDYYAQAVAFTRLVMLEYPGSSVRFSGHSLGSALAMMVSLKLSLCNHLPPMGSSGSSEQRANAGVVGAGTAGVIYPALQRVAGQLDISTFNPSSSVLLNQYYDPIYNTSVTNGGYGVLCLWGRDGTNSDGNGPPSAACQLCYNTTTVTSRHIVDTNSVACSLCMMEVHVLKAYIGLVKRRTQPICFPRDPVGSCAMPPSEAGAECLGGQTVCLGSANKYY